MPPSRKQPKTNDSLHNKYVKILYITPLRGPVSTSRFSNWHAMHLLYSLFEWICLIPVIGGSIYFLLSLLAIARFRALSSARHQASYAQWPPVTLLKPVCGLDKNQRANLRSACLQDYPQYQVVFAVQGADDPVIPLLREIEVEFGPGESNCGNRRPQCGPKR